MATSRSLRHPRSAASASCDHAATDVHGQPVSSTPIGHHRTASASEDRVARVLRETPRRRFFPDGIDRSTPDDQAVPLDGGRIIPPVNIVAMMLRALDLEGSERVLDVSGGSGYVAALLGALAREVVSVDQDDELVRVATSTLSDLDRDNVRVVRGDVLLGWKERAPYQGIIVGAAATEVPPALVEQLDLGGRLVIPLGDADAQLIQRLYKRVDNLDSQTIGACHLDMLPYPDRRPSYFPWAGHRQRR